MSKVEFQLNAVIYSPELYASTTVNSSSPAIRPSIHRLPPEQLSSNLLDYKYRPQRVILTYAVQEFTNCRISIKLIAAKCCISPEATEAKLHFLELLRQSQPENPFDSDTLPTLLQTSHKEDLGEQQSVTSESDRGTHSSFKYLAFNARTA